MTLTFVGVIFVGLFGWLRFAQRGERMGVVSILRGRVIGCRFFLSKLKTARRAEFSV